MHSPETYHRLQEASRGLNNAFFGKHHSCKTKEIVASKKRERIAQDPVYRKIILEASYRGWLKAVAGFRACRSAHLPNKAEAILSEVLERLFPNEFRYNDGWFTLDSKFPDFVDVNNRKLLVDLFGEGYHKPEEAERRVQLFANHGWKALVVWARELKNIESLEQKLRNFVG